MNNWLVLAGWTDSSPEIENLHKCLFSEAIIRYLKLAIEFKCLVRRGTVNGSKITTYINIFIILGIGKTHIIKSIMVGPIRSGPLPLEPEWFIILSSIFFLWWKKGFLLSGWVGLTPPLLVAQPLKKHFLLCVSSLILTKIFHLKLA